MLTADHTVTQADQSTSVRRDKYTRSQVCVRLLFQAFDAVFKMRFVSIVSVSRLGAEYFKM